MNDLIEGLLQFALLGMVDLEVTDIDLSGLAAAMATEVERRYPAIKFHVEPGLRVDADAACVRTLLENLFENAAKYSPQGGDVRFGRSPAGSSLQVWDQGIGFDPRNAERIFDPFARLVSDSKYPGTGLGLASVKKVAEMHGGRVWAESEPGKGSTFFFTLGND